MQLIGLYGSQKRDRIFSPLLSLKKEDRFKWDPEHQEAFEEIKSYLMNPHILLPPMRNRP